MCTLALYFQEFREYPLVLAANRDEHYSRPSASPRQLTESPVIAGGQDLLAGGTWLGVSEHGLVAGILNRRFAPDMEQRNFRSRGLLCLDILRAKSLSEACTWLNDQNGTDYRPFNLLLADSEAAYIAYNAGSRIPRRRVEKGLHVFTNTNIEDPLSQKTDLAHVLFSEVKAGLRSKPSGPLWVDALRSPLSNHSLNENSKNPKSAICVHTQSYGTVSSAVILQSREQARFLFYHASGPPCRSSHEMALSLDVS
jgi:uncharacterized protein with NRDE domain